jgi:hypothetical protein
MFPRLLDGRTTANRRQRWDAKPRAPLGQPSYRMRSIQVSRHRGAKSESSNSDPRTCGLENLLLLHALRSGPSRAGAGRASPWSRRFQCERHQTNMKRSTPTPISQKLHSVSPTSASGSRFAVSARRRSPLNRLDCSGGHDCPLSTPCLPLERSRSEAGGRENATQGLASTDRRDVCGDGHRWRLEEMRFRWIRGDRSFRYAARLDGSSEPLDVEGCLLTT